MSIFWSFIVALGLSIDTFAVAVSSGVVKNKINFANALKYSFVMACFQGGMLFTGGFLGFKIQPTIEAFDHWVAFGLLVAVGINMILSAFKNEKDGKINPLKFATMILLALATSIDALAVGFSFAFSEINVYVTVLIVSIVTFFSAMLGLLLGKSSAKFWGKKLEIIGGLILIGIGLRILFGHINHF